MKEKKKYAKARRLFGPNKNGSVEKFDEALKLALGNEDLLARAVTRIGLPEETLTATAPLRLDCSYYGTDAGPLRIRVFKDGTAQSSVQSAALILFGERQLYLYRVLISMTDSGRTESLVEIDYDRISAVSHVNRFAEVEDENGSVFSVPVGEISIAADGRTYSIDVATGSAATEAALVALRLMIRSKK